jgi:outer membrane murein-binding lipoprotein Lpp
MVLGMTLPVLAQTSQSRYGQRVKILAVVVLGLLSMSGCASRPSIEEESRAAYQQDQQDARIDEFARSLRPQ